MKTVNHIIHYEDYSYKHNPELRDFLESPELEFLRDSIAEQSVIALGWDGTMLSAIREHHEKDILFLWINFWTKGFLLNDRSWISENTSFSPRSYPLMWVENNWESLWVFFNDINIYSPEMKMVELELRNSCGKLDLKWDGVLISTPAGSTGHNKSYHGPILPHSSEHLIIHPRGNITPQSPKTIDVDSDIAIKNVGRKMWLWINLDGQQRLLIQNDGNIDLEISKITRDIRLLISESHLIDWDQKVMKEQGFTA